jgi:hypothetical protein
MHPPEVKQAALGLVHAGLNDCEVARRTGISRTTIRDWRRPPKHKPRARRAPPRITCPRCWRPSPQLSFSGEDYAELLGLYLGDGYIVRMGRTWQFRLYLDSRYVVVVDEAKSLIARCFPHHGVGRLLRHGGRMAILTVYSSHLPCAFPQHGPGTKHARRIALESWQRFAVERSPWRFLRGLIRSDGCVFVNRTGPYEYLSYDFTNHSQDILDLFGATCQQVGVEYRRYSSRIRVYRRGSVALLKANVGVKR